MVKTIHLPHVMCFLSQCLYRMAHNTIQVSESLFGNSHRRMEPHTHITENLGAPDPTFSVRGPSVERYPERQCPTGL